MWEKKKLMKWCAWANIKKCLYCVYVLCSVCGFMMAIINNIPTVQVPTRIFELYFHSFYILVVFVINIWNIFNVGMWNRESEKKRIDRGKSNSSVDLLLVLLSSSSFYKYIIMRPNHSYTGRFSFNQFKQVFVAVSV